MKKKIKEIDPEIIRRLSKFSQVTSFSQQILRVAIFKFVDESEVDIVKQAFLLVDSDNSGFITL